MVGQVLSLCRPGKFSSIAEQKQYDGEGPSPRHAYKDSKTTKWSTETDESEANTAEMRML